MKTAKMWGAVLGVGVGVSPVGEAVADIAYWACQKVPMLADIPEQALSALVIAGVAGLMTYVAPKNRG